MILRVLATPSHRRAPPRLTATPRTVGRLHVPPRPVPEPPTHARVPPTRLHELGAKCTSSGTFGMHCAPSSRRNGAVERWNGCSRAARAREQRRPDRHGHTRRPETATCGTHDTAARAAPHVHTRRPHGNARHPRHGHARRPRSLRDSRNSPCRSELHRMVDPPRPRRAEDSSHVDRSHRPHHPRPHLLHRRRLDRAPRRRHPPAAQELRTGVEHAADRPRPLSRSRGRPASPRRPDRSPPRARSSHRGRWADRRAARRSHRGHPPR